MRDTKYFFDSNGVPLTGYVVNAYEWQSGSPYYDVASPVDAGTYTELGNGIYYLDVTVTKKATIVYTPPVGGDVVPTNMIGIVLEGDNRPDISPT